MRRAFLTGGTGFVGHGIARALVEAGFEVRALVRRSAAEPDLDRLARLGVERVTGDLLDPGSYQAALAGTEAVFHAAAIHATWVKDPDAIYQVNVEGTRRLHGAAIRAGCTHFVHTSSIKTMGITPGGLSDEATPYQLWALDGHYGRSKKMAEDYLIQAPPEISVKILNPCAVIGTGDGHGTPTMAILRKAMASRMFVGVDTSMGLVDVEDVGRAQVLALDRAPDKARHLLCAGNMTLGDLVRAAARIAGRRTWFLPLPFTLAMAVAGSSEFTARILPLPPLVTRSSLRIARMKPAFDGSRAAAALGFAYLALPTTLQRTVQWLLENPVRTRPGT